MAKKEQKTIAWEGKSKRGKEVTLLTPAGKGEKYGAELKSGIRMTNKLEPKTDLDGQISGLSASQKAYRAGYLDARRESADMYLADKAKKGDRDSAAKLAASKKKRSEYFKSRKNK